MTADIPAPSSYALAVDIGGTFTDVVLRNAAGKTWVDKTLTTPESLDVGFFRAVDAVLVKAAIKPTAVTDVGFSIAHLESILGDYARFLDVAKLGVGSAYLTPRLPEKIAPQTLTASDSAG